MHSQIVTQLTEFSLTSILKAEFEGYKQTQQKTLGNFYRQLKVFILLHILRSDINQDSPNSSPVFEGD